MITNKYKTESDTLTSPISGGRTIHTYRTPIAARSIYKHQLERGENFHSLAAIIFGSDEFWWVLSDLNPVCDPFRLSVGQIINLPNALVNNAYKRIF